VFCTTRDEVDFVKKKDENVTRKKKDERLVRVRRRTKKSEK
tara:strand:+ start:716 stop:838 length:123 start_codon:yes stop_codon:yes gene_type:complete